MITVKRMALVTAILMAIVILSLFVRANRKIDDKLNKALDVLSRVETNIESSITKLRQKLPGKDDVNTALLKKKDDEVMVLRLEQLKLRDENKNLWNKLLSQIKEKDLRIANLQDSISWIQKKNEQELVDARKAKDRQIRKIEKTNSYLKRTTSIAVPALIDTLDHHDIAVRSTTNQALMALTGVSLGTDQERWLKWWRSNRSKFAQSR